MLMFSWDGTGLCSLRALARPSWTSAEERERGRAGLSGFKSLVFSRDGTGLCSSRALAPPFALPLPGAHTRAPARVRSLGRSSQGDWTNFRYIVSQITPEANRSTLKRWLRALTQSASLIRKGYVVRAQGNQGATRWAAS